MIVVSFVAPAYSQRFDINRAVVIENPRLTHLLSEIDSLYNLDEIVNVKVEGSSSPDGRRPYNEKLALRRARKLGEYILNKTTLPAELLIISSVGENWEEFDEQIESYCDPRDAELVRQIIRNTSDPELREIKIKALDGGRVWNSLKDTFLPTLRKATVYVIEREAPAIVETFGQEELALDTVEIYIPEIQSISSRPLLETSIAAQSDLLLETINLKKRRHPLPFSPQWLIKSNIPAWAMSWINISGEIDLDRHYSVSLPIYYSGFDYFRKTRKFRLFAVQPEARYWFGRSMLHRHDGWYVGLHGGFAFYNFALNGDTRYQDHDGNTPAWGGGLSAGYRFNLGTQNKWKIELSLGAGVYRLDYDTFQNRPNGFYTGRHQRTLWCIDNVAVSVCRAFDIYPNKTKGGRR